MGGEQRLGEHVVEGPDPREGDHDRLVHGSTDAGRTTGGGHALVAAHDRDDRAEHRGLHDRAPEVGDRGVGEEGGPEARQVLVVDELRQDAAEDAEDQRVDVEQAGDQHQRQEARHDQVLDRVHAQHLERVQLLADLAGAEVGGDRGAGHAGHDHRVHPGRELADRGQHEEAPEPVERAEQGQEVGRLQARGAVAEGDRRDQQREPAKAQREQELRHELAAVGVGRADRRDDRLAGQDHHVADLLEQVLGGQEGPVGGATNHARAPSRSVASPPCAVSLALRETSAQAAKHKPWPWAMHWYVSVLFGEESHISCCDVGRDAGRAVPGGRRVRPGRPGRERGGGDYKVDVSRRIVSRPAEPRRGVHPEDRRPEQGHARRSPTSGVTVDDFYQRRDDRHARGPGRPVWIVNSRRTTRRPRSPTPGPRGRCGPAASARSSGR